MAVKCCLEYHQLGKRRAPVLADPAAGMTAAGRAAMCFRRATALVRRGPLVTWLLRVMTLRSGAVGE